MAVTSGSLRVTLGDIKRAKYPLIRNNFVGIISTYDNYGNCQPVSLPVSHMYH